MNGRRILVMLLMVLAGFAADGQSPKKKGKKAPAKKTVVKTKKAPPSWAPAKGYTGNEHVYFPDYRAFYDPKRGYVYWDMKSDRWTTSQQLPSFMTKADQPKTRVHILKGLDLDLHPEANYPNYMKLYPPRTDYPDVPVPNQRQGYK